VFRASLLLLLSRQRRRSWFLSGPLAFATHFYKTNLKIWGREVERLGLVDFLEFLKTAVFFSPSQKGSGDRTDLLFTAPTYNEV